MGAFVLEDIMPNSDLSEFSIWRVTACALVVHAAIVMVTYPVQINPSPVGLQIFKGVLNQHVCVCVCVYVCIWYIRIGYM